MTKKHFYMVMKTMQRAVKQVCEVVSLIANIEACLLLGHALYEIEPTHYFSKLLKK